MVWEHGGGWEWSGNVEMVRNGLGTWRWSGMVWECGGSWECSGNVEVVGNGQMKSMCCAILVCVRLVKTLSLYVFSLQVTGSSAV